MSAIRGEKIEASTWFDGVRISESGEARTRRLGTMSVETYPAQEENYTAMVGDFVEPVMGSAALDRLGTTREQRATIRAQARSAHVDAALRALGIR